MLGPRVLILKPEDDPASCEFFFRRAVRLCRVRIRGNTDEGADLWLVIFDDFDRVLVGLTRWGIRPARNFNSVVMLMRLFSIFAKDL